MPENVNDILKEDFWILNDFSVQLLDLILGPVKFESSVSIFVKSGYCDADINLQRYHIEAPAMVNIRASQIMQKYNVSPDFKADFIVLSKRLADQIVMLINDSHVFALPTRYPIVNLSKEMAEEFDVFYNHMAMINKEQSNPYLRQTILYTLVSFFYRTAYLCYPQLGDEDFSNSGRLPELFLNLVQQNFRSERFLPFYADKLGVTTRHLSRIVKKVTGYTAGDWIERYVILEAKVLLRSTNLSIQQVSEQLNFPSQSFFGKYFKKHVGSSPKQFRNKG